MEHANHEDDLPDGAFYDGNFFRDVNGNIFDNHPSPKLPRIALQLLTCLDLDNIIREHLQQANDLLEKQNAEIQDEWDLIKKLYEE